MATMITIRMPARLMATTDLTGSRAVCSSARDLGTAGAVRVGVAGVTAFTDVQVSVDAASLVDADMSADADTRADRSVAFEAGLSTAESVAVQPFTVAVGSMAAEAVGSTVVAAGTAAADTGNCEFKTASFR
jgi:hypothetical protein